MHYVAKVDFSNYKAGDRISDADIQSTPPETIAQLLTDGTIDADIAEDKTVSTVVTEELLAANPDFVAAGMKVGDTVQLPKLDANDDVPLENVENPELPPTGDALPPEEEVAEVAAEEPVLMFDNKKVVSTGTRVVNDKEVHTVRLEDGSTQDVSDEAYEAMVVAAQ